MEFSFRYFNRVFFWALWTVVIYSVLRLNFIWWNWLQFNSQSILDLIKVFLFGLRFDISSAFLLASPIFLLSIFCVYRSKLLEWLLLALFVILQTPLLIVNMVDIEFVNFVGRRFTFDSLFIVSEVPGKIWQLIDGFKLLAFVNLIIYILFLFGLYKINLKIDTNSWSRKKRSVVVHILASVVFFLVFTFASRGGFQLKPIGFADARVFAMPSLNNAVLNSTFTFVSTLNKQTLPRDKYFENEPEMLSLLNGSIKTQSKWPRINKKLNVVVLIVESLSLEYMGKINNRIGYTPFLDELAESKNSILFKNAFANGRRSIEGVAAILAGIPALMEEPFISSQFQTNTFNGIGSILGQNSYSTHFFHGGANGTMRFDSFAKSSGIDKYYGLNEYPNKESDFDGTWGIFDEPYLEYVSGELSKVQKPFFATVFTLSSHQPYSVPAKYKNKFDKGSLEIHESIGYADYSLKKFFEVSKGKNWYNDTVFIITSDHTQKNSDPKYNNEIGRYRIPLIIYSPAVELPKIDDQQVVQQIDILPTILDVLNIETKQKNYLGQSVFVEGDKSSAHFMGGQYYLISKNFFLRHRLGDKSILFNLNDPSETHPLDGHEFNKISFEHDLKLKAYRQYFSQGMWDNKLYFP